jgi:hypothetical protein
LSVGGQDDQQFRFDSGKMSEIQLRPHIGHYFTLEGGSGSGN